MSDALQISPDVLAASKSTRTEERTRELARAKIQAKAAYEAFAARNVANLSEEQLIDLEIEGKRLWDAYWEAMRAFAAGAQ